MRQLVTLHWVSEEHLPRFEKCSGILILEKGHSILERKVEMGTNRDNFLIHKKVFQVLRMEICTIWTLYFYGTYLRVKVSNFLKLVL